MAPAPQIATLRRLLALYPGYSWRLAESGHHTEELAPAEAIAAFLGRPGSTLVGVSPRGAITIARRGSRIVVNRTSTDRPELKPLCYPRRIPRAVIRRVLAAGREPGAVNEARRRETAVAIFVQALLELLPSAGTPAMLECGAGPAPWGLAVLAALAREGRRGKLTIVDRSGEALSAAAQLAEELQLPISAVRTGIEKHRPSEPPDLILAVHACGEASLSAASLAVTAAAGAACIVPCCAPPGVARRAGLWDERLHEYPVLARRLESLALGLVCAERLRSGGFVVETGDAVLPPWRETDLVLKAYHPRASGQNKPGGESRGED